MNGGFAPVYTREASAFAGAFCMKSGHLWGGGKVLEKMGERRKYVRRDATVGRLSTIFLEDRQNDVKSSTLECYRRNIQCHILPALGECVAAEVTA